MITLIIQHKCDACVGNKVTITAEGLVLPCNDFETILMMLDLEIEKLQLNANDLHFVDGKQSTRICK